jgi:hypothetical protein
MKLILCLQRAHARNSVIVPLVHARSLLLREPVEARIVPWVHNTL